MVNLHLLTHSKSIAFLLLAGVLSLGSGLAPVFARDINSSQTGRIQFISPPSASLPVQTFDARVRGIISFVPPPSSSPQQTTGGGTRDGNFDFAIPSQLDFRPPKKPAPDRTIGSGVRGEGQREVVALLPETHTGYTVLGHPNIYVYVPPTSVRRVFFGIKTADDRTLYQTTLDISGNGDLVSIALPESAPELEIGREYIWFFAPIQAGGALLPDNATTSGSIQRVAADSSLTADGLKPVEKAILYARQGIWYDTLSELVQAQQAHPEDAAIAVELRTLLAQVGLERVADRAIAEPE